MTPEIPFDPEIRYLELEGARVSYTDDGERDPALVLIHGLPGSVRDFRWLAAAVSEIDPSVRVVRIDLPGFGATDVTLGGDMTVEARSRFVADVCRILELQEVVLIGHSMGGALAIGAAALNPEPVARVVLLSSVGLTPHKAYRSIPNPPLLARIVCSPAGRRLLPGALRKAFGRAGFPRGTPTEELFLTTRIVGAVRFSAIRTLTGQVVALGIPFDVFIATDDPFVELSIAQDLADELGATVTTFADGGHNIQKTRAVEIATALAKTLGRY
ncbi:MAG: alpha/beta hydrolase [Acidimicrobiia bacterium]|nr:alpha/beta hydrolase [Acidimicrobiia bacterium]